MAVVLLSMRAMNSKSEQSGVTLGISLGMLEI